MPNTPIQSCDVKVADAWHAMPVEQAYRSYRDSIKRCSTCHGAIMLVGSYTAHPGAHIRVQHLIGHDGCPQMWRRYNGTPTRHPTPLL